MNQIKTQKPNTGEYFTPKAIIDLVGKLLEEESPQDLNFKEPCGDKQPKRVLNRKHD